MGTQFLAGGVRAAVLLLALLAMPAQAVMYKWVDREGRVNYGDDPPAGVKAEPLGDKGAVTVLPAREGSAPAGAAPESPPAQVQDQRLDRLERELAAERAARQSLEYDVQAQQAGEEEIRIQAIERCRAARGVDCEINYERYIRSTGGMVVEQEWVLPNRRYHQRPLREADPGWGVKSWPPEERAPRPHRPDRGERPVTTPPTPPSPPPVAQPPREEPRVQQGLSVPQRRSPSQGSGGRENTEMAR